mgnify:CR=1 FL=1
MLKMSSHVNMLAEAFDNPYKYRLRKKHDTFWIGVYPGLTEEMLDFVITKIETFLGVNF